MKIFAIVAAALSSLLVLAWPLFLMFSAFLFDAPRHGTRETETWVLANAWWTYPLGYIVAVVFVFGRKLLRKNVAWWAAPVGFLFLLPFAQLASWLRRLPF